MLRTALMLSAAAMLMLSTPTMAQAQLDENSQAQAQVHELTPPESSADASPGLEGDNDLGQADSFPVDHAAEC